jgi:hypothetical protein
MVPFAVTSNPADRGEALTKRILPRPAAGVAEVSTVNIEVTLLSARKPVTNSVYLKLDFKAVFNDTKLVLDISGEYDLICIGVSRLFNEKYPEGLGYENGVLFCLMYPTNKFIGCKSGLRFTTCICIFDCDGETESLFPHEAMNGNIIMPAQHKNIKTITLFLLPILLKCC